MPAQILLGNFFPELNPPKYFFNQIVVGGMITQILIKKRMWTYQCLADRQMKYNVINRLIQVIITLVDLNPVELVG